MGSPILDFNGCQGSVQNANRPSLHFDPSPLRRAEVIKWVELYVQFRCVFMMWTGTILFYHVHVFGGSTDDISSWFLALWIIGLRRLAGNCFMQYFTSSQRCRQTFMISGLWPHVGYQINTNVSNKLPALIYVVWVLQKESCASENLPKLTYLLANFMFFIMRPPANVI